MIEYNFSLGKDIKLIPYICSKKKYKLKQSVFLKPYIKHNKKL